MRNEELKRERNYYRKQLIEGYEKSLNEGVLISVEDIKKISNNFELGAFVRKKLDEKQENIKTELLRLKTEHKAENE